MDEKIPLMFERIQAQGHIVAVVTGRALYAIYRIDGIEKAKNVAFAMPSKIF